MSLVDAEVAGAVIDRMFDALSRGDFGAAQDCLTAGARVWHSYDRVAHDRDGIMASWQGLANFSERQFVDVRRQPLADGFLQQHLMVFGTAAGKRKAWPVCIIVRVRDGLIDRLDEYIDLAGSFEPPVEGRLSTPGLE